MKIVKALLFVVLIMSMSSNVLAGYSFEPDGDNPTTNGKSLWTPDSSILEMEGELYGSTVTFTVKPTKNPFTSSGIMYLKVGCYKSYGFNRDWKRVNKGDPSVEFSLDLDDYTKDNYIPEKFFARYETDEGGWAWVGPLKVYYYKWKEGNWSNCNSECQQTREVSCKCVSSDGKCDFGFYDECTNVGSKLFQYPPDSYCSGSKPGTKQSCNGGSCTYSWEYGDWTTCDSNCEKTRDARCERSDGQTASDRDCSGSKDDTQRDCTGGDCTYSWEYGDWTTCDSNCEETRDARCERSDGQTASDRDCSGSKDDTQRDCTGGDCTYSWEYGDWTTCDSNCEKTREVWCKRSDGQTVSDGECSGSKEETQRDCTGGDCPSYTYSWEYGDWNPCDSNCEQTREVWCERSDGQTASDRECSGSKEDIQRDCTGEDCPGEDIPGDINGDKNLNIFDLQILINVIRKTETDPGRVSRADLNGDSKINIFDLQRLINLIRGNAGSTRSTRSERDPIEGNTLILPDIQVEQNDTGNFILTLSNEDAVASGEIRFTYNSSVGFDITNVNIDKTSSRADRFSSTFQKDNSDPANVEVMALFYSTDGLTIAPGAGEILKVSYETGTATGLGRTALMFKEALLSDLNADQLQVNTRSGEILFDTASPEKANVLTLPDIHVKQNDTGDFVLNMSNEDAVASGEIRFIYDTSVGFDVIGVNSTSRADGFSSTFQKDDSDPANVEVMALFYSTDGLTIAPGSGEILKFSYETGTAAESETTALTFKEALLSDLNADSLEAGAQSGKVSFDTASSPKCLDVNGDGTKNVADVIYLLQYFTGARQ